jgi:hypothetical protein
MTTPFTTQRETILDDIRIGFGKNSWYVILPLSSCRNLFEKEETGFYVQAFVCKCGHAEIFVINESNKIASYVCPVCENTQFFTLERLTNRYGDLLVNIENDAELSIDQGVASAKVYLDVPKSIDLSANRVVFEKRLVYEIQIELHGGAERHIDMYKVSPDVMQVTHMALLRYIYTHYLRHKLKNSSLLAEKMTTSSQVRKTVKFFLQYPLFENAVFLFWHMDEALYHNITEPKDPENFLAFIRNHRSEKSIKKSLYRRYIEALEHGKFDPLTPYIICHFFTDANHICRLLDADELCFSYDIEENIMHAAISHINLLLFLEKFLHQKALVHLFTRSRDLSLWEDCVFMYDNLHETEAFSEHFRKPRASITAIHAALIRVGHFAEHTWEELDFSYTKETEACCLLWHDRLDIRLPKTSLELMEWSKQLNNCLYGYIDHVYHGFTTIFGVFIHDKLTYAIEIKENKIIQMERANNKPIQGRDLDALMAWHKRYFVNINFVNSE